MMVNTHQIYILKNITFFPPEKKPIGYLLFDSKLVEFS